MPLAQGTEEEFQTKFPLLQADPLLRIFFYFDTPIGCETVFLTPIDQGADTAGKGKTEERDVGD